MAGDYQSTIDQVLTDKGVPEKNGGNDVLFHCQGGDSGLIDFIKDCGEGDCVTNSDNNGNDLCGGGAKRREQLGRSVYRG